MRAAIYARLSREDKARSGTSVESTATQIAYARAAAEREGWSVVEECVFSDIDISGAEILNRPGLQALLAAAGRGQVDVVLIRDLDRLARDALQNGLLLGQLTNAGVKVYAYSDRALVPVSGLEYTLTLIKGTAAEMERAQTAKRVREKVERIVDEGGAPGRPPFGYRLVRRGAIPCFDLVPEQAEIVREIGRVFVACDGVARQTALALDAKGILSPSGGKWRPSTILDMMRNPLYRGVLRWGQRTTVYERGTARERRAAADRILTAEHPELRVWPDDLLQQIDQILARPRQRWSGATSPRYMASGFVRCGVCGRAISVRGRPSGTNHYLCGDELRRGRSACRGVGAKRVERVDAALTKALMPLIDGDLAERALEIVRERLEAEAKGTAVEQDRRRLEQSLRDVEQRQARLAEAIAQGDGDVPRVLLDKLRNEQRRADELREGLAGVEQARKGKINVARGVKAARERLKVLSSALREGGASARPVLDAVLGKERMRAVPVREGGAQLWHMSASVGDGWLLASVTDDRHPPPWRPPPPAPALDNVSRHLRIGMKLANGGA